MDHVVVILILIVAIFTRVIPRLVEARIILQLFVPLGSSYLLVGLATYNV